VSEHPRVATHRILSWNVNGLRACAGKGFRRWLDRSDATIVGVQEVRARREDLPRRLAAPRGWHTHFEAAARRGYSGVGLFARRAPDEVATALGTPSLDREGRLQLARFGRLVVANVYFPNGNGTDRDHSRIPYKLRFYRRLFERLEELRADGLHVLALGDYNTTRSDLDLARPKDNRRTSGCLPHERREFERWIDAGWVDTFRTFEPGGGHYSWWSQRVGVRARNIGWRIDHVLASPEAMPFVRSAFIQPDVLGSDHAPVGVEVDDAIFGDSCMN
jgi:exodeoxyribonuclease-3